MKHPFRLPSTLLFVILALAWNDPLSAQCRMIGFEADIIQPADDLPFTTQLQASQNVIFSVDNSGDLTGDAPAVLEAVGVQLGECGGQTCGFQSSNGTQAFDTSDPNVPPPGLGTFFLRLAQMTPLTPLLIDFTNPEGVSTASGEIWDLDAGEQWLVEAYDRNNTLIASQTSPRGQGLTFDSRPWRWTLSPANTCPIFKIRIRYIGAQVRLVGLAFDNLNFCDITPAFSTTRFHCADRPLSLKAAAATPPDHQWDLIPSDGSGTSDSDLTGPSIHRCWGPTCIIPPPLKQGTYVIKHGIFSSCLPWREQREQIRVIEPPNPIAGPDQRICAGEEVRLPAGCSPRPSVPWEIVSWSPTDSLTTVAHSRCTSARPTQTTTYTIRERGMLGGCTGADSAVVEITPKPEPIIELQGPCCSQRLVVTGKDIDQVRWSSGEVTSEIPVNSKGVYTVVAKNRCGEGKASRTVDAAGIHGTFSRIGAASGFQPPAKWWIFDDTLPLGARPAYGATAYRLWIYSHIGTEERHKLGLVAEGSNCSGLRNGEISWDGKINGRTVQNGTYFWVLQLRNCDDCHTICPRPPPRLLGNDKPCEAGGEEGNWCNWHRVSRPKLVKTCTRRLFGLCVRYKTVTRVETVVSKVGVVVVIR